MRNLDAVFRSPPKGGNAAGAPTANPMTPVPAPAGPQQGSLTDVSTQKHLGETFLDGVAAAKNNQVQSGRADQPELRNFDRGELRHTPMEEQGDTTAAGFEAEQVGWRGRVSDGRQDGAIGGHGKLPRQTLTPKDAGPRTDGKKTSMMPKNPPDGPGGYDPQSGM